MKQIILVRHALTELIQANMDGNKRNDSPLVDHGKKQAEEVKKFLTEKNYNFEVVLTSLFQRSIDTGKFLAGDKRIMPSYAFNEYFLRDDGSGVESTDMGAARAMSKIYSLFDTYEEILIVGHSSINKTILQNMTNGDFNEIDKYFKNTGETHILRYDWKIGDKGWSIVDSFTPSQK